MTTGAEPDVPPLCLRLFGPFELRRRGELLPRVRVRRGHWLLALLTLRRGHPVERAWLAGILWPDSPQPLAFRSLRSTLAHLRHVLGPEADRLRSPTIDTLCFDLAGATVDLLAFDTAIARGDTGSLEEAVSLYRGPLLEECREAWILAEREAREQAALDALEKLSAEAMARGDLPTAERRLRAAVAIDPVRESAQRALIQALAAGGNYAAALETYRDLRLLLHRELNSEPDPETQRLYERIKAEARQKAAPGSRLPAPGQIERKLSGPASDFPSSAGSRRKATRHNLPRPLTRFIGRERERAEVRQFLGSAALVTLIGAGGCGKTRLALQVAADLLESFPDGAWVVELAALADPALTAQTVASTLGLREQPGRPLMETLIGYLAPRSVLLVLDNCEHLLDACTPLASELLRRCANLRILATSREALGIVGEQAYPVPPLSYPDPRQALSLEHLQGCEAVQLFLDRAASSRPKFALTEGIAAAVAEICRRLDGIPLAIELAAARVKALPVETIAERLEDRFRLLTGGGRAAIPRHQTLRALIDWSYDLLSETERGLLRRLAVFAGGWTLNAVEAICGDEALDPHTRLVEKSLVILGEAPEHAAHPVVPRYRLLETVRQYARDRLRESDESTPWSAAPRQTEEERMRERHLAYFVSVAEELAPGMSGPAPRPWLERCEQEYDNLRAALEWAVSGGAIEAGPRLAEALFPFWMICGYMYEGRRWTEAVLARSSEAPLSLRARLLWLACQLAQWGVDREAARCFAEKSLALRRELGDREGILGCLDILADLARGRGDIAHAGALREEAILLTRELGRRQIAALRDLFHRASGALERGEGNTVEALCAEALALQPEWEDPIRAGGLLHGLGLLALEQESYTLARVLFERSLDLTFPEVRSERGESRRVPGPGFSPDPADYTAAWPCDVMSRRALAARCQGDLEAAWRLGKECLAYSRQMGERTLVARSLADLARVAIRREDPEAARPLLHECLTLFEEMGHPWGIAETLEACAGAASALGEPARAARLLGAADALRERAGKPLWPYERPDHARTLAAAQDALGEWSFAAAWKEGRAMAPEQAVRYALQEAASQAFARSR